MYNRPKFFLMLAAFAGTLVSCSKDGPETADPVRNTQSIDASDYASWTYINLETGQMQTLRDFSAWNYLTSGEVVETVPAQGSERDITIPWHIAIHRYDIRTNNGQAAATAAKEFSEVTDIPTAGYEADETAENEVITDMSGMMQGKIGYAASAKLNRVLCAWLTRKPTGSMPPYTYEPTGLIYVVKFTGGSYAKLKFTDYQSADGASGHVTFSSEFVAK